MRSYLGLMQDTYVADESIPGQVTILTGSGDLAEYQRLYPGKTLVDGRSTSESPAEDSK